MSKDSYNLATVPHYAHEKFPPIRPRAPRSIPEWVLNCRIKRAKYYQAIYKWIRRNFQSGDLFFIGPDASNHKNYCLANRFGIFLGLKSSGWTSRVVVDWQDGGHKIQIEPITFYYHSTKLDQAGNEIPTDLLNFEE